MRGKCERSRSGMRTQQVAAPGSSAARQRPTRRPCARRPPVEVRSRRRACRPESAGHLCRGHNVACVNQRRPNGRRQPSSRRRGDLWLMDRRSLPIPPPGATVTGSSCARGDLPETRAGWRRKETSEPGAGIQFPDTTLQGCRNKFALRQKPPSRVPRTDAGRLSGIAQPDLICAARDGACLIGSGARSPPPAGTGRSLQP